MDGRRREAAAATLPPSAVEPSEEIELADVVEKAGLHYAVIYDGGEPDHRAGAAAMASLRRPSDAEALACQLQARRARARRAASTMTVADYLIGQWLPAREAALSPTTYAAT